MYVNHVVVAVVAVNVAVEVVVKGLIYDVRDGLGEGVIFWGRERERETERGGIDN